MEQPTAIRLSDEQIASFQRLYFEQFGAHISKDEALTQGIALVVLLKAILDQTSDDENHRPIFENNV